jgi:hypothetical protein
MPAFSYFKTRTSFSLANQPEVNDQSTTPKSFLTWALLHIWILICISFARYGRKFARHLIESIKRCPILQYMPHFCQRTHFSALAKEFPLPLENPPHSSQLQGSALASFSSFDSPRLANRESPERRGQASHSFSNQLSCLP